MDFKDILSDAVEHVMDSYDEDGKTRPPELAEAERKLHKGFDSWTRDHSIRYPRMGRLPYRPDLFPDQRIDRAYRPINLAARLIAKGERSETPGIKHARPAIYLARLAYLESLKFMHAKTVGSRVMSEAIVLGFLNTPAFGDENSSPTIVEYAADCLEDNKNIGLTSAHLKELSDIAELVGGLSIGMAEVYGFKYIDRINTVVNSNMTRQTYKIGKLPVPISKLAATGTGILWGVPLGESAAKHGIQEDPIEKANLKFLQAFGERERKAKMVLAYVPTGSGAVHVINKETGELVKIILKSAEATSTLTAHCDGGIIPANRYGEELIIGSVIKNEKPDGVRKKDYTKMLVDEVMQEHAQQAAVLTGVPTEYLKLFPEERLAYSS